MGDGRQRRSGVATRSVLHEEPPRNPTEGLRPPRGDLEALADLEAPRLLPDGRDEVETHTVPEDSPVARAEAHRPLSPVRRVRETDRIADAALLAQPVPRDRSAPRRLDVLAGRAGPSGPQRRRDAFDHRLLRIEQGLRGLTEIDRAGQRAVIAPMTPGELEERRLALPEG